MADSTPPKNDGPLDRLTPPEVRDYRDWRPDLGEFVQRRRTLRAVIKYTVAFAKWFSVAVPAMYGFWTYIQPFAKKVFAALTAG